VFLLEVNCGLSGVEMEPIISIIVPVYNVEEYIDCCMRSLMGQSLRDIEIVLVDDGSPDDCPALCDAYALKDNRVKVLHKKNGGLSSARNAGLKAASGQYIIFVDPDDFIETDTCERFVSLTGTSNPDIVAGNGRWLAGRRVIAGKNRFYTNGEVVDSKEYLKSELRNSSMNMSVWLYMFKKTFLVRNRLEFKLGILHEDEEFTPRAFLMANQVIGTGIYHYNCLIREGSISTGANKRKRAEDLLQTCREHRVLYAGMKDSELRYLLNDRLVYFMLEVFRLFAETGESQLSVIDKSFLKINAYTAKNRRKVFIFLLNPQLYLLFVSLKIRFQQMLRGPVK